MIYVSKNVYNCAKRMCLFFGVFFYNSVVHAISTNIQREFFFILPAGWPGAGYDENESMKRRKKKPISNGL